MITTKSPTLFIPTKRELVKIFGLTPEKMSHDFIGCNYKNLPIIVTGVGKTNAALTASRYFQKYCPSYALLTGICGAYQNSGLQVGDVVSITKDYFVDECVFDGEKIITLAEKNMPPHPENYAKFLKAEGLKEVASNTVSFIAATDKLSSLFTEKTGAETENMEGAAFGVAAEIYEINVYQIRSVSNFCGDMKKQCWNIEKAAKNLKAAIDEFIS